MIGSTLPLFVAAVFADHAHSAFAADDLAVPTNLLHGSLDFHGLDLRNF